MKRLSLTLAILAALLLAAACKVDEASCTDNAPETPVKAPETTAGSLETPQETPKISAPSDAGNRPETEDTTTEK